MGKTTTIVSDFSGQEVKGDSYYGLTITNFATKSSAKFFISHDEFMDLAKTHNLKPDWESWANRSN